jgi:uncharacterized protein (TIGR03435 family)
LKLRAAKEGADNSNADVRAGKIVGNNLSMTALAVFLARFTGMPVVDDTQLQANYKVHLEWTPDRPNATDDTTAGTSVFAAAVEQLGLKLEARKSPMEVIVVDHAERTPAGN